MSTPTPPPATPTPPIAPSPSGAAVVVGGGGELSKAYKPSEHEQRVWNRWIAANAFHADPAKVLSGEKKPYCIVIPPPNVTDRLHLGHALNNSLQDILARAHRMMGFETLWMPGTDHAGIATQAVVEKRLKKEENTTRQRLGREKFIEKVQAFKDEYEAVITGQLKAMGCSCDWERQRFTMDPVCARAVREAFFRLFKDGLIYRGKRLVNWDPALQTAVADDECYDEEVDAQFYYLRYPLVEESDEVTKRRSDGEKADTSSLPHSVTSSSFITVATTRPETYLGDTAVAINPKDPRAKSLVGRKVRLPLINREIPIIADDYAVLPEAMATTEEEKNDPKAKFSTGFVKITPAHDANDYALWQRHVAEIPLGAINMMSPDGKVSDTHGLTAGGDIGEAKVFVGKSMAEARKMVVKEFESRGLLESVKPYRHSLNFSDRSKAVIEPYLSDQWYVRVTDPRMAATANAALVAEQRAGESQISNLKSENGDGSMRFYPARYAKTYEFWHDNIRDWCISRQLWWGHRIPVWSGRRDRLPSDSDVFQIRSGLMEMCPEPGPKAREELATAIENDVRRWSDRNSSGGVAISPSRQLPAVPSLAELIDEEPVFVCLRDPSGIDRPIVEFLERRGFVQDPDVLDTWFSSALWPMSTMGWPDPAAAGPEFKGLLDAFNPTTTLCTAREIITLWVSRMVMFNRYFRSGEVTKGRSDEEKTNTSSLRHSVTSSLGPPPFRNVFIHAVIQDGNGQKMSKSLGNGVDPLDIIATHGSDAMRFTLCQMTTQTQDVRMPVVKDPSGKNTSPKFDLGRNFANKLWNASKFAFGILGGEQSDEVTKRRSDEANATTPTLRHSDTASLPTLPDRWMLSRLATATAEANKALENFEFADYANTLYTLLWNDYCDWYLEAIKPTVAENASQRAVLRAVLDTIVRLLHPIMPFVTEVIYEKLNATPGATRGEAVRGVNLGEWKKDELLCLAAWPKVDPSLRDENAEAEFERMRQFVTAIRDVRSKHQVKPSRRVVLHGRPAFSNETLSLVTTLAGLSRIEAAAPAGPSVAFTFESVEFRLSDLADAAAAGEQAAGTNDAEKSRLTKQIADLTKEVGVLMGRLSNPGYTDKAPPHMVQQTRDQLTKKQGDLAAAEGALRMLG